MQFFRLVGTLSALCLVLENNLYAQKINATLNAAEKKRMSFDFPEAIKLYKQILELQPHNPVALDGISEIYLMDYELYDSAQIYIEDRIKYFKEDTLWVVYFHYANCLRLQENHEKAIEIYQFYRHNGIRKEHAHNPLVMSLNENIEYSQNALRNQLNPYLPFEVTNMDFFVNSVDPEYTPVYIEEQNLLLYNARYKDHDQERRSEDNKYHENIYYFDLDESVASTYNPGIDQEFHQAVASKGYDNDTIVVFWKNQCWVSGLHMDRLDSLTPLPPAIGSYFFMPHAIFTEGGRSIIFSAQKEEIGNLDLWVSHRTDTGWTAGVQLSHKINTGFDEDGPFLSHDGKRLYFSSKGHNSSGGYDFFVSELEKDGSWGPPHNLGYPMNSAGDDIYISFKENDKNGFFSSNREGGFGGMDIYSFGMLKKTVRGTAKDQDGNLLAGVLVELTDMQSGEQWYEETNEKGDYSFLVDPERKFAVLGTKEKYFEDRQSTSTYTENDYVIANLALEKDPGISLYILVQETETKEPIDSAHVTIVDNMVDDSLSYLTGIGGDFIKSLAHKKLQERGSYNIRIEKDGFLTKTVTFNVLFDKEGRYNVHEYLDISLEKVEVGNDLTDIIDLLPIYFDVNKSNIRPDAAIELDKIVKVMNDNPEMIVELGSHTDARGSAISNQKLSDRRAKSSAQYIKERITNPERITGTGHGESKLVNACSDGVECTELEHQANRRTEFIIVQMTNPG
jgi:outer membrane protein OmpA-like peptidoglycan-associated protein